jgi:hypothetical protein
MTPSPGSDAVLVLNAGSSSIKLSLFRAGAGNLALDWHGELEGIGTAPHFHAKGPDGVQIADGCWRRVSPIRLAGCWTGSTTIWARPS